MVALTPSARTARVLMLLLEGKWTKRALADELGASTSSVKRSIRAIEQAGVLVEIEDRLGGGPKYNQPRLYRAHLP